MQNNLQATLESLKTKYPNQAKLIDNYIAHKQEHIFSNISSLQDEKEVAKFFDVANLFDLNLVDSLFKDLWVNKDKSQQSKPEEQSTKENTVDVIKNSLRLKDISSEQLKKYQDEGIDHIANGRVCVLLMSGGQGTRLGFDHAKGLYDIGMPSKKTIFEYHANRIKRLSELVCQKTNQTYTKSLLRWYLMTSEMNHTEIVNYFKQQNYFGLGEDTIVFFQQSSLPAIDYNGKIIMSDKNVISQAPDGNGGVFGSLIREKLVDDMKNRGIRFIHLFGVDNVLVKPADPLFLGFAGEGKYQISCKFVPKAYPEERVGVHLLRNGRPDIIEYSEMSKEMSEELDKDGNLLYDKSHIVNSIYSIEFLEQAAASVAKTYHLANKSIKYYDNEKGEIVTPPSTNGLKFELFYFDVFRLSDADKFGLLEVLREEEFAPIKNAPGSKVDGPDQGRQLMSGLHCSWLNSKDISFDKQVGSEKDSLCEINVSQVYDKNDPNLDILVGQIDKNSKLPLFAQMK